MRITCLKAPSNVSLEAKGCLTLTDVIILPSFLNALRLPVHTISARVETITVKVAAMIVALIWIVVKPSQASSGVSPRRWPIWRAQEGKIVGMDLLTSTAVQCEGPEVIWRSTGFHARLKGKSGAGKCGVGQIAGFLGIHEQREQTAQALASDEFLQLGGLAQTS